MARKNVPSKGLKQLCSRMGSEYSIQVIDSENVLYRKISDYFDIEVSGVDNNKTKMKADVYLWRLTPGKVIEERIFDITTEEQLKSEIDFLVKKYSDLT